MLPRRTVLALVILSALLTAGCGEIITNLHDLAKVRGELIKNFGGEVSVHTTGGEKGLVLVVWFFNSPLNDQAAEARQKRAEEAAQVVKASYRHMQRIAELLVGFMRKKTEYAVFDETHIVSVHGFDKNAQPLSDFNEYRPQSPGGIEVTSTYSPTSKDTDIAVYGLQLEGEPGGMGVTLLPYFKLLGDARAGRKLRPPKIVELNFASYAEKPRFKQTVPIIFVVDKAVAVKTEGDFMGGNTQFCYLRVPYSDFRRIVGGNELTIKLGDKEYTLTPSQLGAMKQMTQYVQE